MSDGISVELNELVALKRFAFMPSYRPEYKALRIGTHLSRLRGRGMDFAEVRNYQPGDELRHMEWRVTARTGKPHVKLYQEERERPAMLWVDFSESMHFGTRVAFKSVTGARLAALIAWIAIQEGDRAGGLVFTDSKHEEFQARAREKGIIPFLKALSDYSKIIPDTSHQALDLKGELERLKRVSKPGSIIILISDFYKLNENNTQQLSKLRAHNDVIAYHICDPIELKPPSPAIYAITNGQEDLILNTEINSIRHAYQNFCEQRVKRLEYLFKQLQIQYIQVTAEDDLAKLVRKTYPKRQHA